MTRRNKVMISMGNFNDKINDVPSIQQPKWAKHFFLLVIVLQISSVILSKSQNTHYALQILTLHSVDSSLHAGLVSCYSASGSPCSSHAGHRAVVLNSSVMLLPILCSGSSLCREYYSHRLHMSPFLISFNSFL